MRLTPSGGYTELYTFSNVGTDGYYPITVPAWGSDGNLYGIAPAGGANGNGVVYRLTPQGSYSVVHAFDPYNPTSKTNLDGDNIYLYENRDLTLGSDGSLYGSLSSGGALAGGTNFAIGADGTYTALTSTELKFIGSPQDGKLAEAASGTFYGVTGAGNGNGGTLFRMVVHSGTSVNAKVSTGSTTLYHPVKISWTSTNAASCALIGDLPKKLKVSVPLNGSKTWYPSKSGRAVVGVQCKTADGGQVNSAQAVVVN